MIILIIDKYVANDQSLDEIVYTGITRCKEHLYIINMNNNVYDKKLKMLIDSMNGIWSLNKYVIMQYEIKYKYEGIIGTYYMPLVSEYELSK